MKRKFKLPYVMQENLRLIGLRPFVKWGIIGLLIAWLFWPDEKPAQKNTVALRQSPHTAEIAPASTKTEQDLREVMTAQQTSFYWESFLWMMRQGPELKPRSFDGRIVFVTYLKDAAFKAENGLNCRPFSEKLIVAGKFNARRGIACERNPGNWCRQIVGEKAQCRSATETGFAADTRMTLRNMRIDWDRNLGNFGF